MTPDPGRAAAGGLGSIGWQPIETVPCDGTAVLLWDGTCRAAAWTRRSDGSWGWDVLTHDGEIGRPTHWMPLPTPSEPVES